jgi:hypothetical protein
VLMGNFNSQFVYIFVISDVSGQGGHNFLLHIDGKWKGYC